MKTNISLNDFKKLLKTPEAKRDMDEITDELFSDVTNAMNDFKSINKIDENFYNNFNYYYDYYKNDNSMNDFYFNKKNIMNDFKSIKNSLTINQSNAYNPYEESYNFGSKEGCIV
ncbi:hypothetical protein [Apilactobacillus quenuiae]|uniref:hypothetical protein n=1 Tax=Apilactobacillus quenuiae TaxID=2008377 RepID=UPI000D0170F7|nr:hypothetical protein [Apilactobacillus quenuiae]